MSREIKFRAWDIDCHRFEYFEIGENDDCYGMFRVVANKFGSVVEQYTGLKDKNGREIYEGDIVRVSYGYNYEARQFKSGAWRIGRDDLCVWADSSEVIGNIHENPELLGGKK